MKYYVTLTGLNYRFGTQPFTVGQKVKLVKEPENGFDREAIRADCRVWARWVMWPTALTPCWATVTAEAASMIRSALLPPQR